MTTDEDTAREHLRAAIAHATRALGLAFGEGVGKEARVAVRAARDLMHEAIESMARADREIAAATEERAG